jgi:hypothetical protein
MYFRAALGVLLACFSTVACMGEPEDLGAANLGALTARTEGTFLLRRDVTRDGFVVSPVNGGGARCADGHADSACPVDEIDFGGMNLSPAQVGSLLGEVDGSLDAPRVIVRGRLGVSSSRRTAQVVVSDAWRTTTDAPVLGTFYEVATRAGLAESRVNSLDPVTPIAALAFDDTAVNLDLQAIARREAATATGVLVTGFQDAVRDARGEEVPCLRVQQVFVRVTSGSLSPMR